MITKRDNIHFNLREIDGYNKSFNFIISAREAGKSSAWIGKAYKIFKDGGTSLIVRRQIIDITEAYILSIQEVINKFDDETFCFEFKKGEIKDGIVLIYAIKKETQERALFACIVGLSVSIARVKSLVLRNIKAIFFDEFIVNPNFKEKYLPNEADRFKELYNTFYRESEVMIKTYFLGNPYSHYNPYFLWLNVDTHKLKEGARLVGSNWIVECYPLTQELKKYILKRNPLYEFDDSYTRYGFNGEAVCDENIKLGKMPSGYYLQFVFRHEGKNIGVFQREYFSDEDDDYFITFIDDYSVDRTAFCFDFSDLVNHCALISLDDKYKFARLRKSMQRRLVAFSSIEVYYIFVEVYNNI